MKRLPTLITVLFVFPVNAFAEKLCMPDRPDLGISGRDCPYDHPIDPTDVRINLCFKAGPDGRNEIVLTPAQRRTRVDWAYNCGYIQSQYRVRWEKQFTQIFDPVDMQWVKRETMLFPLYGTLSREYKVTHWWPENLPGYPGSSSCVKPSEVLWLTNCN